MICLICGRKLSQEGSRVMEKNEIKDIGTAVCPVCGGRVIQRKSTAACATIRSIHYCECESEWKCTQCGMNFSAETKGRDVLSREAYYEEPQETGIQILGSAAPGSGDYL